jgi:hypothetical protein
MEADDRTLAATGKDISFNPKGDIVLTGTGDISTSSGSRMIEDAVLRRLNTPEQGYVRWLLIDDEVKAIGSNYKNSTYSYLSSDYRAAISGVKVALDYVASQEDRIIYEGTEVEANDLGDTIYFYFKYQIKSEGKLRVLTDKLKGTYI